MSNSPANLLCKACGLCCSGHLFSWVRLNAPELDPIANLGIKVIRNDPRQRGFNQPCPMWNGVCSIYETPEYPRSCQKYKCVVFKRLADEDLSLPEALKIVQDTLDLISEVEALLPLPKEDSFRERLLAYKEKLENGNGTAHESEQAFLQKSAELLFRYESRFGVDDFIDFEE